MVFLGLAAAWLGRELDRAYKQRAIVLQLKASGMKVVFDFDRNKYQDQFVRFEPPRPPRQMSLLRTITGQDMFAHVDQIGGAINSALQSMCPSRSCPV